jgi:galactonate dehydratase
VYANGLVGGDSPAGYGEAAARVEERGFRMTKFMPFAEEGADSAWPSQAVRERGVERLAAVRAATGDAFEVAVEFHGVHAPAVAVDLCERVAPYEPTFVEEPVPPEDHDALRRIRDAWASRSRPASDC